MQMKSYQIVNMASDLACLQYTLHYNRLNLFRLLLTHKNIVLAYLLTSKAFDAVNHELFFNKLSFYGVLVMYMLYNIVNNS